MHVYGAAVAIVLLGIFGRCGARGEWLFEKFVKEKGKKKKINRRVVLGHNE